MKSKNYLGKLLIGVSLLTFVSLGVCIYSLKKLYEKDPQLLSRLQEVQWNDDSWFKYAQNSSVSFDSLDQAIDEWNIGSKKKRITIKTYNGNFEIHKSKNSQIHISAKGKLDKSVSPRLLEVEDLEEELVIQQPKNDAVTDLSFVVEVPADTLENLNVFSANSDFLISGLDSNEMNLKSVQGEIVVRDVKAKKVDIKNVQGDIRVEDVNIQSVISKTVSGNFNFKSQDPASLDVLSVSGEINLDLSKNKNYIFEVNSVSGNITNIYKGAAGDPIKVKIVSTSGDVNIE